MLRTRRSSFLLTAVLLLALALLAAACTEDNGEEATTRTDVGTVTLYSVTVTEDGLDPGQVELRVPERARLVVENESATACAFDFGPYVKALRVPAGESTEMAFVAEDLASTSPPDPSFLEMGCQSDGRRGEIQLLTSTAQ